MITEVSIVSETPSRNWVIYFNNGELMQQFRSTIDSAFKLYEVLNEKEEKH